MKFFWYVKALHIIHESEMTKIMPSRISPGLSDTTHRAKWSVNIVSCRLFFVKTVYRQPNADWLLFLVCLFQWRLYTNSQMESNLSFFSVLLSEDSAENPMENIHRFLSVFLCEDSAQTVKRRVTEIFCFSQWRPHTDGQWDSGPCFLSTVLGEDSTSAV
jgi:hypothetical protein